MNATFDQVSTETVQALSAQAAAAGLSVDEYLKQLLQEQDELKTTRTTRLRQEIQKGLDQLERGEFKTYHSVEEIIEHVKAEGRRRLAKQKTQ
ncbi:MAG: hypothetical protein HOP19_18055 [Acidobacteria bacterium]|nr:hypothetical protein [Acidobacteriota bacterium]